MSDLNSFLGERQFWDVTVTGENTEDITQINKYMYIYIVCISCDSLDIYLELDRIMIHWKTLGRQR